VRKHRPLLGDVLPAVAAGVLALAPAAGANSQAVSPQPPVFSAGVDLVRIDVIVLDRAGRPVTGLVADDFVVEEDGRERSISSFEQIRVAPAASTGADEPSRVSASQHRAPQDGRCLFLLFDDVHVTPAFAERVRAGLRRFLDEEVREGDWVTLMAPDKQVWWTARSGWEYRQMRVVVDGLKGLLVRDPFADGISDYQAVCMDEYWDSALCGLGASSAAAAAARRRTFQPVVPGGGATGSRIGAPSAGMDLVNDEIAAAAKRRISVIADGLHQALDALAGLRGHKSVILISEGFVFLPKMAGYSELVDAARRANVAIHFLDPRGLETVYSGEFQDGPPTFFGTSRGFDAAGAGYLADVTGGYTIFTNDPVAGLRQIAAQSEAYYLLGYTPETPRPGERKVRVRVKREGLTVHARTRYFVGRGKAGKKKAPRPRPGDEGVGFDGPAVAAMRSVADATELPLRAETFFFDANARGEVATLVAAELEPEAGRRHLKLVAEARRADGGTPVQEQFQETVDVRPGGPVVLARQWRLPAGVWQARVLAQDAASGRVGSVVHTFEVPAPQGLRLSSPLLTGEIDQEDGGARPRLALGRVFAPKGRLYCQFNVYGAGAGPGRTPRVTSSWELRRGGVPVRAGTPTPIAPTAEGRLTRLLGLSLAGAEPGDYSLVLRATDEATGRTVVDAEEFTIR
jgi:VWFA-related protein